MNDFTTYKISGRVYFQNKNIPRKPKVMKRLGARKNTFAGNMISRMYDYYYKDAINFRKEYRKYYKKEFETLEKYIEERFNLDYDDAVRLAAGNYSIKECSRKSIERNIETLDYDEDFKNVFSEAVGGLHDEDPDGIYY